MARKTKTQIDPTALSVETVDVATLKPHPRNARHGNIDAIMESLNAHGQYRPLVVQKSTKYVLAGNHTLMAANELGWPTVAVSYEQQWARLGNSVPPMMMKAIASVLAKQLLEAQ